MFTVATKFFIRGEPATKEEAVDLIELAGGEIFTLAACEPDRMSKTIYVDSDGNIRKK